MVISQCIVGSISLLMASLFVLWGRSVLNQLDEQHRQVRACSAALCVDDERARIAAQYLYPRLKARIRTFYLQYICANLCALIFAFVGIIHLAVYFTGGS